MRHRHGARPSIRRGAARPLPRPRSHDRGRGAVTDPTANRTPTGGTPTGGVTRASRLLALPLAFGGRAAAGWGRRLAGADPTAVSAGVRARNAEHLFAVLGRLKGGA